MQHITQESLEAYVTHLLNVFYSKRIASLQKLELRTVLLKKNPYLHRAIGTGDASEIVENLLNASISSSDETIFGNDFFEPLSLWVAKQANADDPEVSARTSSAPGADIEVERDRRISLYAVKSGTSVFNGSSKKKQREEFQQARSRLHKLQKQFDPVIAYGYGRKRSRAADLREVAGQAFWEELSGEPDFYLRIVHAMGEGSAERTATFKEEYDKAVNRFTRELLANFASADGELDWGKLVSYNSAQTKPRIKWDSGLP